MAQAVVDSFSSTYSSDSQEEDENRNMHDWKKYLEFENLVEGTKQR